MMLTLVITEVKKNEQIEYLDIFAVGIIIATVYTKNNALKKY